MDALDSLKIDHDRLRALVEDMKQAGDSRKLRDLFETLRGEFEAHALAEEKVLYPFCERFENTRTFIPKLEGEHLKVRNLLAEMGATPDNELLKPINTLEQLLAGHIDEEERVLFPEVRQIAKRPEREHIGRQIENVRHAAKRERGLAA